MRLQTGWVKSPVLRHHLHRMQRLSGLDASFLYFETPSMHMHIAMTAIFDPSTMPDGYQLDRIKEGIA